MYGSCRIPGGIYRIPGIANLYNVPGVIFPGNDSGRDSNRQAHTVKKICIALADTRSVDPSRIRSIHGVILSLIYVSIIICYMFTDITIDQQHFIVLGFVIVIDAEITQNSSNSTADGIFFCCCGIVIDIERKRVIPYAIDFYGEAAVNIGRLEMII